jgi:hypothetical protein
MCTLLKLCSLLLMLAQYTDLWTTAKRWQGYRLCVCWRELSKYIFVMAGL